MNPLFLDSFGANLTVSHFCLQVKSKNNLIESFEPRKIPYDTIVLNAPYGFISLEAHRWLSEHGISILSIDFTGKPLWQTYPIDYRNVGDLKLRQFIAYMNPERRFEIAKQIIRDKVGKEIPTRINTLNKLLMFEAYQAQIYFRKMGIKRIGNTSGNQNASDLINCALNYGYAILESLIRKFVISIGLEPSIGFLHSIRKEKEPLVYDLQEPFRHWIDEVIIQYHFKKSQFHYDRTDYSLFLKPETAHDIVTKIGIFLNTKIPYKNQNWKREGIILDYMMQFAKQL